MTYSKFQQNTAFDIKEMCSIYYRDRNNGIKIKKEHVAVKNLTSIITATLALSIQKGFHEMSLRDLCDKSGLSMGAVYTYINSKDDIASMIHDIGYHTITEIMNRAIDPESSPSQQLMEAIKTHLYLSERMQKWFYFFFMETKNLKRDDRGKSINIELRTEKFFLDILGRGVAEDGFSDVNITLMASTIKAMMQDWYLKRWKYKERKITVEEYADFIYDFVISYILKKD